MGKMNGRHRHRLRRYLIKNGGDRCFYCGVHLLPNEMTIDHFNPISNGGRRTSIENVVAACEHCNNKKDNKIL